jgi:hypothetical protein
MDTESAYFQTKMQKLGWEQNLKIQNRGKHIMVWEEGGEHSNKGRENIFS